MTRRLSERNGQAIAPKRRSGRSMRRRRLLCEPLESRLYLTVPAFSSLPGALHTIYLDFDGQTVENTSWNSYYNQTTLVAPPFDIDGNPASFSATELSRIEEAWNRVAEDFRPFQVNVTTVEPNIEALRKSGSGDTAWGVRAIVTNEANMVTDSLERCGCGGIAYINSFNSSIDMPVWVYTTGGKSIAEAASHEVGHSLGLAHDGNTGSSYYTGHGAGETSWAPIMGVGYNRNVTQWDRGEYFDSNNFDSAANYGRGPDDLAIIVGINGFGYRTDDHGDTTGAATALSVSGTSVSGGGIIERTTDADVFSFNTGAGAVTLNVAPFTPGPNLDIRAELLDGTGAVIATSDNTSLLGASFSQNLAAGQYYVRIDGTGWGTPGANPPSGYSDYGSLGQYSIAGSIVDPGALPAVSISDASANEDDGTITFTLSLSSASASATSVNWATADISAAAGSDYVAAGGTASFAAGQTTTTVTVTLIDDSAYEGNETFRINLSTPVGVSIADGQADGTIVENDSPPAPSLSIGDAAVNEGKFNTKGKNAGTPQLTSMVFSIVLSAASPQTITVSYATSDGSATVANNDYQAANGVVTFLAGETSKTISVTIVGDNTKESNETFSVTLSSPANATISDGIGIGTILDDDSGKKGGGRPGRGASEGEFLAEADPIWFFESPLDGHVGKHSHGDHHVAALDELYSDRFGASSFGLWIANSRIEVDSRLSSSTNRADSVRRALSVQADPVNIANDGAATRIRPARAFESSSNRQMRQSTLDDALRDESATRHETALDSSSIDNALAQSHDWLRGE